MSFIWTYWARFIHPLVVLFFNCLFWSIDGWHYNIFICCFCVKEHFVEPLFQWTNFRILSYCFEVGDTSVLKSSVLGLISLWTVICLALCSEYACILTYVSTCQRGIRPPWISKHTETIHWVERAITITPLQCCCLLQYVSYTSVVIMCLIIDSYCLSIWHFSPGVFSSWDLKLKCQPEKRGSACPLVSISSRGAFFCRKTIEPTADTICVDRCLQICHTSSGQRGQRIRTALVS